MNQFALLAAALALPSAVSAAVIMNETFSGDRTTYTAGSSTQWFASSGSDTVTYVQQEAGSLTLATGSSGRHLVGYFTAESGADGPVSLDVGDTLTVTLSFTLNATTLGNSGNNFRIGLFDSTTRIASDGLNNSNAAFEGYTGYALMTNVGASGSVLSVRKRTNTSSQALISTAGDFTTLGANQSVSTALAPATAYTATITLQRSAEGLSYTASIVGSGLSGYSINRTDATPVTVFDTIVLSMTSSTADSFTLTGLNIVHTSAVPEPSAFAALAGLAALGLVASRRRR